jgi:hypothetical protein
MTTVSAFSMSNGATVERRTIDGGAVFSDQASIIMNNSNTLRYTRVRSIESLRVTSDDTNCLVEWCYLESVQDDPDGHGDTIQFYPPGGGGGTFTLKNTMLALGGYANAAYFAADSWSGNHVLDHVCFLRVDTLADAKGMFIAADGGGTISCNHVYFVRSPAFEVDGNLAYLWQADRPIVQWTNVYLCDLDEDGMPINLTAIPEP